MSSKRTADEVSEVTILETREALPSHFLMRVESFSLLGQNGIHKYESGEFSAGGHKWRLILYPNEDKTGIDSEYISVHLAISHTTSLQPTNWEDTVHQYFDPNIYHLGPKSIFSCNFGPTTTFFVKVSCNLNLTDFITKGPKVHEYILNGPKRMQRFQAMKSEWGISKFISKEILMNPSNGFLIDDNCVFGAEVFILEKPAASECHSVKNVTIPYKRDWKISNFSKLGDQWTSEKFDADGVNWEVRLFPKGANSEKGRYLSTCLVLIDSKRVKASFSICIRNQIDNKHKKINKDSHWFSPTSDNWGWTNFIKLTTLEDPENGFIIKDSCVLEIELSVQAVV